MSEPITDERLELKAVEQGAKTLRRHVERNRGEVTFFRDSIEEIALVYEGYLRLRKALAEIAKGEGRFSRDHLEHATNTIEDMKRLAVEALRDLDEEEK